MLSLVLGDGVSTGGGGCHHEMGHGQKGRVITPLMVQTMSIPVQGAVRPILCGFSVWSRRRSELAVPPSRVWCQLFHGLQKYSVANCLSSVDQVPYRVLYATRIGHLNGWDISILQKQCPPKGPPSRFTHTDTHDHSCQVLMLLWCLPIHMGKCKSYIR